MEVRRQLSRHLSHSLHHKAALGVDVDRLATKAVEHLWNLHIQGQLNSQLRLTDL